MRTGTSYFKTFSKMMWIMPLLLVVITAGCDRDHGVAKTAPTVVYTIPADGAIDVPLNSRISAAFSEPMDAATVANAAFFTVTGPGATPVIAGTITYDAASRIALFTPNSNLAINTIYTGTITVGARNAAGTSLANNFVWTFTTGVTVAANPDAPTVTSVTPADIASGTCINQSISATFSEPMSAPTITAAGTFTVKETFGSAVTGTVTYDAITIIATFTTITLTPGTNYTATITTAATDVAGTALAADKVWSFTAGSTICAPPVNMGLAAPFGIAATAGVTNTLTAPITHINGDVVLDPLDQCNAVVVDNAGGFGLCGGAPPTINGQVITNTFPDAGLTSGAVKADLNAAFLSITPSAGPPAVGSLDGGTPLAAPTTLGAPAGNALVEGDNLFYPGVYTSITSIFITDDITLDAQGDPNARFVFQSSSSLTTADGAPSPGAHARILLINGAKASNVWWQVASSATLGLYTEFNGNILAAIDITMKTGATSCGRLMAGAWVGVPGGMGAFIFDSNVVSVPGHVNAPASCR